MNVNGLNDYFWLNRSEQYVDRLRNIDAQMTKYAIPIKTFHGEAWFKCPHCGKSFEYYDTVYERGFKRTTAPCKFLHLECGKFITL